MTSKPLVVPVVLQDEDDIELLKYWTKEYFKQVYGQEIDPDRVMDCIPVFVRELLTYMINREHYVRKFIKLVKLWKGKDKIRTSTS